MFTRLYTYFLLVKFKKQSLMNFKVTLFGHLSFQTIYNFRKFILKFKHKNKK